MGRKAKLRRERKKPSELTEKRPEGSELKLPSRAELKSVVCSLCGRRRNVSVDTEEQGYICLSCRPAA